MEHGLPFIPDWAQYSTLQSIVLQQVKKSQQKVTEVGIILVHKTILLK